jgi:hypothetical protein
VLRAALKDLEVARTVPAAHQEETVPMALTG